MRKRATTPGLVRRIDRTLEILRAVPGVEAAARAVSPPGVFQVPESEIRIAEGRGESESKIIAINRYVSSTYFATMSIPLLAGDPCRAGPVPTQSPVPDALVNRRFAAAYFDGSSPIGLHLPQPFSPPAEIRGIVGDAREQAIHRVPVPTVYWCTSAPGPSPFFLIRTRGEPNTMADTIRRKIHEIEPLRSVFDIAPLEQRLGDTYAENRLRTVLLSFFALTAMCLASVGLYGTLSYLVTVRRREVGLRLALGAIRAHVVRHFLAQGLGIAAVASLGGLALAAAFARLLTGMLYGVSPTDPATLAAAVGMVLTVAAIASLLPALRAARLDPMEVLRDQ
jgi:putative ABC transport system permease protein